jgi:hypothetical protein
MVWVADSTQPGYLGPAPTETLLQLDWENFLQFCVAGITNLPSDLVRPRWQVNPVPTPDTSVDWAACGIVRTTTGMAYHHHYGQQQAGPGYDILSRQERVVYRVSFYGPHAGDLVSILRDGLSIDQNRAMWRANAVGLVEAGTIDHVPDLYRTQFRDRYDLEIILNREVRRFYLVRNLRGAEVLITANDPGGRVVQDEGDTPVVPVDGVVGAGPNQALMSGTALLGSP